MQGAGQPRLPKPTLDDQAAAREHVPAALCPVASRFPSQLPELLERWSGGKPRQPPRQVTLGGKLPGGAASKGGAQPHGAESTRLRARDLRDNAHCLVRPASDGGQGPGRSALVGIKARAKQRHRLRIEQLAHLEAAGGQQLEQSLARKERSPLGRSLGGAGGCAGIAAHKHHLLRTPTRLVERGELQRQAGALVFQEGRERLAQAVVLVWVVRRGLDDEAEAVMRGLTVDMQNGNGRGGREIEDVEHEEPRCGTPGRQDAPGCLTSIPVL